MKKKHPLLLFILIVFFQSFGDSTNTQSIVDPFENSVDDTFDTIPHAFGTGTHLTSLKTLFLPMSITTVTEKQIKQSGATTMSELLEIYIPGFQVMINKWNGTIWGLRGVSSDTNDKFIFLLNGIKLNLQSRDGAITEMELGLLGDIETIYVVRGPSGLAYGSGAIAGVVNIITKKNDTKYYQTTSSFGTPVAYKTNPYLLIDQQFALQATENLTIYGSFGFYKTDGIGQENGSIWGFPSAPYPENLSDLKDQGATIPQNWIPVTGSHGKTPGNYRISFGIDYKNVSLYSRFTRHFQYASGWFGIDVWPHIIGNGKSNITFPVTIKGKTIYDSTDSETEFWRWMESYGDNRRIYKVDNLATSARFTHEISTNTDNQRQDTLISSLDFNGTSQYILYEKLGEYNTFMEPDKLQEFGEKRFTLKTSYQLNRFPALRAAFGHEARLDFIGKSLQGKNEYAERPNIPVVENVTYINNALFAEAFYDLFSKNKFFLHGGFRSDFHKKKGFAYNKNHTTLAPKLSFIYTPQSFTNKSYNIFKLIFQSSANFGTADIHEKNYYFYDVLTGELHTLPHLEDPLSRPDETTPLIPAWNDSLIAVVNDLKPEKSTSIELATYHRLLHGLIQLRSSLSYTIFNNMFLWDQTLFRRINTNRYDGLNLTLEFEGTPSEKFTFIGNHTFQKIVNSESSVQTYPRYYIDTEDSTWIDSTIIDGKIYYSIPKHAIKSRIDTLGDISSIVLGNQNNYLNIAPHISKFTILYHPHPALTFNLNSQIYWSYAGRSHIIEQDLKENEEHSYLSINHKPIVKVNGSIHYKLSNIGSLPFKTIHLSLIGKNLLSINDFTNEFLTRNTLRIQQMSSKSDRDLYSVDLFSVGLHLHAKF